MKSNQKAIRQFRWPYRSALQSLAGIGYLAVSAVISASGATYTYDFGTGEGTYNTPSGTSTTFLPTPPSGTSFVRVGSGEGSLALANPGNAVLGTGSELVLTAATSGSVNKFSIYNYAGASTSRVSFSAVIGSSPGSYFFGTGDGAQFSNGSTFVSAQTFTGLFFTVDPGGAVTSTYRNGNNSIATGLTTTGITTNAVLGFDIYGNNGTSSVAYNLDGTTFTVAPNTFDIFLNGMLIGNDLNKGELPTGNIDSLLFYGGSSAGNSGSFSIDNLSYGDISTVPEPTTVLGGALTLGVLGWSQRRRLGTLAGSMRARLAA